MRKVTLRAMKAVRRLQQNPNLGEFRLHAALAQVGIHLRPRTCRRISALNRVLYGLEKRELPFAARRRHQYPTVDVRYLKGSKLGGKAYVLSLLVNNSRAILRGAVTRTQDLASYLSVLYAAAERYGLPEVLVTDGAAEILTVEHAGEPLSRYEVEAVTGELRSVSRGCSKPLGRFAIRGSSRWTPWARGRMTQGLESRGVRSEEPSPSRGVAAGAVRLSRGMGVASLFSHGTNFGCTEFYEVRMYPILGTPMF